MFRLSGARVRSPQKSSRNSVGGGGPLHGLVEAAAVNVGDFGTHRAEVGGQLSAMMDAVIVDECEISRRGQFENSECRDNFGKLFGRKCFYFLQRSRELSFIEGHDFGDASEVHVERGTKFA